MACLIRIGALGILSGERPAFLGNLFIGANHGCGVGIPGSG